MWDIFGKNFSASLEKFDFNNESRISFSKFSVNRVVKLLTNLYTIEGGNYIAVNFNNNLKYLFLLIFKNYEEKMREQEDKFSNLPKNGVIKQIIKGKNMNIFTINKREEFISYESWKKFQDGSNLLLNFLFQYFIYK